MDVDGVLVNATMYEQNKGMFSQKAINRKTMLNSKEDAIDRFLRLVIAYNSVSAQATTVSFNVSDFNDGLKHDGRKYNVKIAALEKPILPTIPQASANDVNDITGLLDITKIAYVKGTPSGFIAPPAQPIKK